MVTDLITRFYLALRGLIVSVVSSGQNEAAYGAFFYISMKEFSDQLVCFTVHASVLVRMGSIVFL